MEIVLESVLDVGFCAFYDDAGYEDTRIVEPFSEEVGDISTKVA